MIVVSESLEGDGMLNFGTGHNSHFWKSMGY